MNRFYLSILLVLLTASGARGATYTWYFSDDAAGNAAGSDSNAGTEGSPFKSLSKAQDMLDTLISTDTATLYFDRGDTWTITAPNRNSGAARITAWTSDRDGVLWHDTGTVTIDAYGSSALGDPIFDGEQTWGTSCPLTSTKDTSDAIIMTWAHGDLTVRNIEMKRFHGVGIHMNLGTDNILIEDTKFTYFGDSGIKFSQYTAFDPISDVIVQNNEVGYTQLNWNPALGCGDNRWSNAIALKGGVEGRASAGAYNIVVRGNHVYYSFGEGIVVGTHEHATAVNIIENNIISDTRKVAITTPATYGDAGRVIVRNNLIYWTAAGVADPGQSNGIYIYDEEENRSEAAGGGDNSTAAHYYYGNVIINALYGIWIMPTEDAWGTIQIFNNTIIDCNYTLRLGAWVSVVDMDIFDNSFLYLGKTGSHILINSAPSGWTWGPNHWYGGTLPGSPYYVP